MDESAAWIAQAVADRAAAERERGFAERLEAPAWCQTVAKYQQAVEKSIKAIPGVHEAFTEYRLVRAVRVLHKPMANLRPWCIMVVGTARNHDCRRAVRTLGKRWCILWRPAQWGR